MCRMFCTIYNRYIIYWFFFFTQFTTCNILYPHLIDIFPIMWFCLEEALTKSRSKLKILNLNRLLLSGKNRNYRKNKGHWISSDRISQHYLMLLKYQTTISLVPLHPLFNISVCNVLRRIIQENWFHRNGSVFFK